MPLQLMLPATLPAGGDGTRETAAAVARAMMRADPAWRLRAMGPDAYFCWSMVQALEFAIFGRAVRNVVLGSTGDDAFDIASGLLKSRPAARQWRRRGPLERPAHGDGVRLSHLEHHGHVGVWLDLDRGLIAHHLVGGGFALDTRAVALARGYRLRFYEWRG